MEFQCLRRDVNPLSPACHSSAALAAKCDGISENPRGDLAPTFVERVNEYLDRYKRAHTLKRPGR
jgi:hypothetical protein